MVDCGIDALSLSLSKNRDGIILYVQKKLCFTLQTRDQ